MHCGEDHHWILIRIFIHYFFIHLEEVAVTLFDYILSQPADGFLEIEEYRESGWTDSEACIAALLGCP